MHTVRLTVQKNLLGKVKAISGTAIQGKRGKEKNNEDMVFLPSINTCGDAVVPGETFNISTQVFRLEEKINQKSK